MLPEAAKLEESTIYELVNAYANTGYELNSSIIFIQLRTGTSAPQHINSSLHPDTQRLWNNLSTRDRKNN